MCLKQSCLTCGLTLVPPLNTDPVHFPAGFVERLRIELRLQAVLDKLKIPKPLALNLLQKRAHDTSDSLQELRLDLSPVKQVSTHRHTISQPIDALAQRKTDRPCYVIYDWFCAPNLGGYCSSHMLCLLGRAFFLLGQGAQQDFTCICRCYLFRCGASWQLA